MWGLLKGLCIAVMLPFGMIVVGGVFAAVLFGPPYGLVLLLSHLGWNADGTISLASVVLIFGGWWFLAWALFVEPGKVTEWVQSLRQ